MRAVFDFVRVIADGESNVLITGETGTGKELIANLIHHHSRRRGRPFVPVSCAILTETLIEAELFGHERGAFTGAIKDRPGRFELAHGGTIFLDDVDDVPQAVQVKLLRVLQNRTIERVGGNRTIPVNVRFIAGSKRNLKPMVAAGSFRADLYYRLNVFPVALPPLRERLEDIPALVDCFVKRSCARRGRPVPAVSSAVLKAFLQYAWPGNVRELENTCEWIAQTCTSSRIRISAIPPSLLLQAGVRPGGTVPALPVAEASAAPVSFEGRLRDLERSLLDWALEASHGNKSRAAELLELKRSTLTDHLRKHGLAPQPGEPRVTPRGADEADDTPATAAGTDDQTAPAGSRSR
jgi:DNA-binding NtrC family response regulator